jgi:hypothetical protein
MIDDAEEGKWTVNSETVSSIQWLTFAISCSIGMKTLMRIGRMVRIVRICREGKNYRGLHGWADDADAQKILIRMIRMDKFDECQQ